MSRTVRVGVIGCGGFARGVHIPNLKRNPKFAIRAAMDVEESAARAAAEEAGAHYWTTDIDRVLSDPQVDAVFITTRHDSHAELSVRAAQAGKHILCEKPMGLNVEQCRAVAHAVREAGVKYTIGYNRGHSPLTVKAVELLAGVPAKKLVYHRMQAPFPEEHWTHRAEIGGGRFVGEGCHNFDLICRLMGSAPVSVYASGGTFLDPERVRIPDSGIVTITFADGSVGTTLIASAGCALFPKEALEVYTGGRAIFINDFKEMEHYGFDPQPGRITLETQDKGQAAEIDAFADAVLNDTEPPNNLLAAARAAVISFKVNESITAGSPVSIREDDYAF